MPAATPDATPTPAPTPTADTADQGDAQPAPDAPVATEPDVWEVGVEASATFLYVKGGDGIAAGEERRAEQGDYLATVKGTQQIGLEAGPAAEVETPIAKNGVDVSGSVVRTGQLSVSWAEPSKEAADERLASLVPDALDGTLPAPPSVVDAQTGLKTTVRASGGTPELGGAVSVEGATKGGVKVEVGTDASGAAAPSVTPYVGVSDGARGEIDVGGVVTVVGEVKAEAQASLKVGSDGAVASLKVTGEQSSGVQTAADALVAKGVGGQKVEVEIKAPVGLEDVVDGRTFTQSTVSVKTSDVVTGEATYGASFGPDPEGARLAVEGKLTTKQERQTSSWTDTIGNVLRSAWERLTGGS